MKFLDNIHIKNKIIIIIVTIGAVATITGNVINYFYEVNKTKDRLISNSILQAKLLSEYCGLPLDFNYPDNATEVLTKLHSIPDVYNGVLYTLNDSVFASYNKINIDPVSIPKELSTSNSYISDNYIHIKQSVMHNKKQYGYLYLRSYIDWRQIVIQQFIVTMIIILIMLILTIILAFFFQNQISSPIVQLTKKMNYIAVNKDYSVQFRNDNKDEIGELCQGFNTMLSEINKSEIKLTNAFNALKDSEIKWKFAIEGAGDGLWDWDLLSANLFISTNFKTMLGYSDDELHEETLSWETIIHPNDYYRSLRKIIEHLKGETEIYSNEYRLLCKDGSYKWIMARGKVIERLQNNEPKRFIGTHTDITHRKKSEKELIEAKERAEESDRLKSAFLANMSHEIRTPMNGILGFAELLKEPELSGNAQQEYIRIIEESGIRMLNIINDLISISKVEAGQAEVILSDSDINEQIDYIYTFFSPEAERKGLKIISNHSGRVPNLMITTDREKVFAIFTNLVKNAIKYSKKGTIEIGYQTKGTNIEFYVKDTGIGIALERQEAIFERFVQADNSITSNYEGAGLGLAITKAYIEMLGGTIWVESNLDIGSTFYFTLPYNS